MKKYCTLPELLLALLATNRELHIAYVVVLDDALDDVSFLHQELNLIPLNFSGWSLQMVSKSDWDNSPSAGWANQQFVRVHLEHK